MFATVCITTWEAKSQAHAGTEWLGPIIQRLVFFRSVFFFLFHHYWFFLLFIYIPNWNLIQCASQPAWSQACYEQADLVWRLCICREETRDIFQMDHEIEPKTKTELLFIRDQKCRFEGMEQTRQISSSKLTRIRNTYQIDLFRSRTKKGVDVARTLRSCWLNFQDSMPFWADAQLERWRLEMPISGYRGPYVEYATFFEMSNDYKIRLKCKQHSVWS